MSRFRRLRNSPALRALVRERNLSRNDLIQPFFAVEGRGKRAEIPSMPGIYRYSVDRLLKAVEKYIAWGGQAGLFFGIPAKKDDEGTTAFSEGGIVQQAVRAIKKSFPDFVVITDICLCAYTTHGHCGIVEKGKVSTDRTIPILGNIAVSHAAAGADLVAPSDMMDLRVAQIREDLDQNGFKDIPILSYAAKYASAFYGPFREAVDSTPQFGDRKTYQMDPGNWREALKEARQDVAEGADLVMVKPALSYLDVISLLKRELNVPIVAYSVSGEYSMIKAAGARNWIKEKEIVLETLLSMKRAGADLIITYYAQEVLGWLSKDH